MEKRQRSFPLENDGCLLGMGVQDTAGTHENLQRNADGGASAFGSSATVSTVSAVVSIFVSFVSQPFGCSGKLMRLPRSNVDDK